MILIPKSDKDITKKNYRPIVRMHIDTKILNNVVANQIQWYIYFYTMTKKHMRTSNWGK